MHIGPMINGAYNGIGSQYYENGRLNFRGLYESNEMTKDAGISYHSNGQIRTIFGKNFNMAGTL